MKFLIKIILISSLTIICLSTNKMYNKGTLNSMTSTANKLKEKLKLSISSQLERNKEKSKIIEAKLQTANSKLTDLQNKIAIQNSKLEKEKELYLQEKTVFDDFSRTVKSLEEQFNNFFNAQPTTKIKSNISLMNNLQNKHKQLINEKNKISDEIGNTATNIKKKLLKENENEVVNEKDEGINGLDKLTKELTEKSKLENHITSQIKLLRNENNVVEQAAIPIKNDLFLNLNNGFDSLLKNLESEKLLIKNTKQNNKTLLDKTNQINEQVLAFKNILENERNKGVAANLESFQKELIAIKKLNKEHNSNKKLILESLRNNKKLTKAEIHNLTFDFLKYKQIKKKENNELKKINEHNKIINVYADKIESNIELSELEQKLDEFVGIPQKENMIAISVPPEKNDYFDLIKQASNQTKAFVSNIDHVINKFENNYKGVEEKLVLESEKGNKIEKELSKKENLIKEYETMINSKDNELSSKDKNVKLISKSLEQEKQISQNLSSKIKAYENKVEELSKKIKVSKTKLTKEEQEIKQNNDVINKLRNQIKAEESEIQKNKILISQDNIENQKSNYKIKKLESQLEKMKQINDSLMQVNQNEKNTIIELMKLENPSEVLNASVNNKPKKLKNVKIAKMLKKTLKRPKRPMLKRAKIAKQVRKNHKLNKANKKLNLA
jgi:hypothetical protein